MGISFFPGKNELFIWKWKAKVVLGMEKLVEDFDRTGEAHGETGVGEEVVFDACEW